MELKILHDGENDALQMARRFCRAHQFRSLAKIGVMAGGAHFAARLAALDHRASVGGRALTRLDRHRFAGKRGLIDQDTAFGDPDVSRNDVAHSQVNEVAGYQLFRRDETPNTVAQRPRLHRQTLAQQCKCATRPALLDQAQRRVEHQQCGDDCALEKLAQD